MQSSDLCCVFFYGWLPFILRDWGTEGFTRRLVNAICEGSWRARLSRCGSTANSRAVGLTFARLES